MTRKMLFEPIHRDFRDKNGVNATSSEGAVADKRLGRARFLPHESAVALGPAWEQPAFTVKDRTFSVREVIEAAHFRGGLDAWWHKAARIVESELTVDTEAVQVRADEFRTARDLITAEETERWLAVRGLTMEEFGDYFAWQDIRCDPDAARPAPPMEWGDAELREVLRVDLLMSGEFERLVEALAWRLVAGGEAVNRADDCSEVWRLCEAAFQQECAALMSEAARQQAWPTLRLPLTRLHLECLEVESLDAAREALLCVREDGSSMEDVALAGGYVLRRVESFFENLSTDLQSFLLGTAPGGCVGPVMHGTAFRLWRLGRRVDPHPDDASLRERVDLRLIRRHFAHLVAKSFRWNIPPLN